tara:strand:+ start:206 stop:364 length:159 start_codon:yes stop_codon:yes gene_type:complete
LYIKEIIFEAVCSNKNGKMLWIRQTNDAYKSKKEKPSALNICPKYVIPNELG